jgi:hypothetical protein
VAWAERERGRGCAKWDEGASAGVGGAQKGARVRGRATWPEISVCVRECVREKAELTGGSHDVARGNRRVGGNSSAH